MRYGVTPERASSAAVPSMYTVSGISPYHICDSTTDCDVMTASSSFWRALISEPTHARELLRWAEAHPRAAGRALAEAAGVREAIAAVFQAVVGGKGLPPGPLQQLEAACLAGSEALALRAGGDGAEWVWREAAPEPDRPMWAAAIDAARVLTSGDCARVRQCADAECGWFFLDTSRNRSRRWCSMEACGNRNKARRFYSRSTSKPAR